MINKDNYFIDDVEDLKKILSDITDINSPVNGNQDLCCIMTFDTKPIEYLLEQGVNSFQKDKFGLNAFDYVIQNPNNWAKVLNWIVLKNIKNGYIL
ncbi:MAG: hypothetical protein E7014_02115 [Alphaproteobacteria bacterium]|nr:hypothetical protein [Alphaproteobacteria bacterium]